MIRKKSYRIQRIAVKETVEVGVRSNKKTYNTEFPVVIGKPFTYEKVTYKNIRHTA
jgi:hypothetical protein